MTLKMIEDGAPFGICLKNESKAHSVQMSDKMILVAPKDYEKLENKPKINGVELSGDQTANDLGLNAGLETVTLGTSWLGSASPYTQVVTLQAYTVTEYTKADVSCESTVLDQMSADGTTAIYIRNDNGTLTACAVGNKPTAALTVEVCAYETQHE